jgi:uncharacterized protein YjiS (DUF1127 family)
MSNSSGSAAARSAGARSHIGVITKPGVLRRWIMRWLRHHRMRRDEALLARQPDYMLRDIGIGRGEIEAAVRGESRWRRG